MCGLRDNLYICLDYTEQICHSHCTSCEQIDGLYWHKKAAGCADPGQTESSNCVCCVQVNLEINK